MTFGSLLPEQTQGSPDAPILAENNAEHHAVPAQEKHGEEPASAEESAHAATSDAAHGEAHGGGHEEHVPELENFWNLLAKSPLNKEGTATHKVIKHFDPYVEDPIQKRVNQTWQNVFFGGLTVLIIILVARRLIHRHAVIPDRGQSALELLIEGLNNFFLSILGTKHGPKYSLFLISLFCFIVFNNLIGLVPLMKSGTIAFQNNIVLGLLVFFYVQYIGIRKNGVWRYIKHFLGNPDSAVQWVFSPLIFVLEVISHIVRPFSLSLRLYGNILGEDILLGVFALMGIMLTNFLLKPIGVEHVLLGIPLHLPFLFLATLTSIIQALIFSLLSCVYILLMLPHEEEHH